MKLFAALLFTSILPAQDAITFTAPPPPRVSNATALVVGGGLGSSTYYYWVAARYPIGTSFPSGPVIAAYAPVLGVAGGAIRVYWSAMPEAISYDVLRTLTEAFPASGTCACAVATGLTATAYTDTGGALAPYAVSSAGAAAGSIRLDNLNYPSPALVMSPSPTFLGLTGILGTAAAGGLNAVAAASQLDVLERTPNVTGVQYRFAAPVMAVSAKYDFPAQTPGTDLIAGNTTITLTPVPLGVNWNNPANGHYVYVSGGTDAAGVCYIVTAGPGTAVSGAASGTLTLNCAAQHRGAYTASAAMGGLQEAICALPAGGGEVWVNSVITLRQNVYACGKTRVQVVKEAGVAVTGAYTIFTATASDAGKAIYDSGPDWVAGATIHDAIRSVIGNFPVINQFGANTVQITEALVGAVAVPATSTAANHAVGVAGYASSASTTQGVVGLYGGVLPKAAAVSVWGLNATYSNCPFSLSASCPLNGLQNITGYGIELNPGLYTLPTGAAPNAAFRGVYIIGGGNTGTANPVFNAIDIESPGFFEVPKVKWANAFHTNDGAATTGLNLGALTVGNGYGSQPILLRGKTAGGVPTTTTIASNAAGDFTITSGTNNYAFNCNASGATADFGCINLGAPAATEIRAGHATANSGYRLGQDATHNGFLQWIYNAVPANAYLLLSAYGGNNNLSIQRDGGFVAIGAATPLANLDVGGVDLSVLAGGTTETRTGNAAGNSGFRLGQDATHNAFLLWKYNAAPASAYASLGSWGGNNHLVLMEDGGNVGINKVAPKAKLAVVGLVNYANNAAALAGGLTAGDFYTETGTNPLRVVAAY